MTFAAHYREHVVPKLRQQIALQSFFIACGTTSYEDGFAAVFEQARRYGAIHLPGRLCQELRDWIGAALTDGIIEVEPRIDAMEAANEARDPVLHYGELAGTDTQLQWIFAAISPEYRAHLLAVNRARS